MVVRIQADSVSIDANAKEASVVTLSPPEGKVYNILEIALGASGAGYFSIYIQNQRIAHPLDKDALALDSRRILVDWSLKQGEELKIVFTDKSGASNTAKYLIVFEEVPAS